MVDWLHGHPIIQQHPVEQYTSGDNSCYWADQSSFDLSIGAPSSVDDWLNQDPSLLSSAFPLPTTSPEIFEDTHMPTSHDGFTDLASLTEWPQAVDLPTMGSHLHDHVYDTTTPDSFQIYAADLLIHTMESPSLHIHNTDVSATHTTVSPQLLHASTSSRIIHREIPDAGYCSDEEETADDSGNDSEYIPSSVLTLKQRISRRRGARMASTSNRSSRGLVTQHRCTPLTTKPISTSRQSSLEVSDSSDSYHPIRTAPRRAQREGIPNYEATDAKGDFCCEVCGYTCPPQRRLDFKRHVNTHYPHMTGGPKVCCGIPVELSTNADWRGRVAEDMPVRTFYGRRMVGGCGKVFSRTDALLRHLTSVNNPCVGDIDGEWHPPKPRD